MAMYMFRDWMNELEGSMRPSRILDQNFGMGLLPQDLLAPITVSPFRHMTRTPSYFRPWRVDSMDAGSTLKADKEKFQVNLDVQQFVPEEIQVKSMDGCIVVQGKHEEKPDEHGFVARQFVRRYLVPAGYELQEVTSTLSSDGVLTITAPKAATGSGTERLVTVTQTGEPHKQLKDKEEENKQ